MFIQFFITSAISAKHFYQKDGGVTVRSRIKVVGFPSGAVVKNPAANAGGHGFEPWSRKIPHAAEQLSP